jgi:GT2 family glycosyltransferase
MAPPLWFVVLNYNGLEDTRKCLDSLAAVREEAAVLVVDNASAIDPGPLLSRDFRWARFLRNGANEGYAGGNNRGIEVAVREGAEWVVLLNNDTVVAPQAASRLARAAASHPEFGIIGPIISYMEEPDVVRTDGCAFNRAGEPGFFQRVEVPPAPPGTPQRLTEVDIVNGCCLMTSSRVVRQIGLIDERFFLVHEESDYCLRAREAGFRCGILPEVLVWHKGSSSFRRAGHGLQRYFDVRNLALLLGKHGEAQPGRRSRGAAWREYVKYAYFVYSREREAGTEASAAAVVEGLHDALTRTWGPRARRVRPLAPVLKALLEAKRRVPLGRKDVSP